MSASDKGKTAAVGAALMALCAIIYGQTLRHDFINFDDVAYVTSNSVVQAGLTWRGAVWAFTQVHASNWHPLTWLSHMLDCQLFGLHAGGHHLINLLLHAANAALLFLVLRRMTGAFWAAACVAALFAAHPLHVESVAWAAERKDVLSAFFWLLTMAAYATYVSRPSRGRYAFVCGFFALGLMSKPMVVTLPFVLLLLDYWPLRRWSEDDPARDLPRLVAEKIPLLLLSALSCGITLLAQRGAVTSADVLPFSTRASNAMVAYAVYAWKTIWPWPMSVMYPYPVSGRPAWQVITAIAALAAVTLGALALRRKAPYALIGWLWFLGALVPVIGFVQVGAQAYADRYTYVPLIGLFIVMAYAAAAFVRDRRALQSAAICVAVAAIAACTAGATVQARYWRDSETLLAHCARVAPSSTAFNNLGAALEQRGDTDAALACYRDGVRADAADPRARANLGRLLGKYGPHKEAEAHLAEAIRLSGARPTQARSSLADLYAKQGKRAEAKTLFEEALRLDPNDAITWNGLGRLHAEQGRLADALPCFETAVRLGGGASACSNLGGLYTQMGRFDEALAQFNEALRLDPSNASAHGNLGALLAQQGKYDEARRRLEEAVRLDPAYDAAAKNLAKLLIQQGDAANAGARLQDLLQRTPHDAEARALLDAMAP
ncbi:MAG TPA: tetratricopeptide repeat protein [Candidatus Hydrogenedentes bacterium]|nr:tetratricopeptide repeat protein [Candidatus Hydrogenedentota bacterium]